MERHVSVDYSGSDSSGVEAHLHVAIATSLSIDWMNVDWSAGVVGLQECVWSPSSLCPWILQIRLCEITWLVRQMAPSSSRELPGS